MSVIIQNVHLSKMGNMMIKYIAARKLAARLQEARISNYALGEWGIHHQHIEATGEEHVITIAPPTREMEINFERVAYLANTGLVDRICIEGHLQRMENMLPLADARGLFVAGDDVGERYDGHVICPVRGAEILDAIHPGYTLLPIRFYKEVLAEIGKPAVFIGQIGEDAYGTALREAFPKAIFAPNAGAMQDFQTIRKAAAIIVSISTFAWLAAWLSEAELIVLPSFGLFNRNRFPENDLIPIGDDRYRFYSFDVQDAVPVEEFAIAHEALSWHRSSPAQMLRAD